MNVGLDRALITQIIIVVAACGGAWMMIVEPKAKELAQLEPVIAEARTNPMLATQTRVEQMANQFQQVRVQVKNIMTDNLIAQDSARIYGLIMQLAQHHEVQVQRLAPGAAKHAADENKQVQINTFNLLVQASYPQLITFLEAIENIEGFVRPTTLDIVPRESDGRHMVEANVACQAISFAFPQTLTAVLRDSDAER